MSSSVVTKKGFTFRRSRDASAVKPVPPAPSITTHAQAAVHSLSSVSNSNHLKENKNNISNNKNNDHKRNNNFSNNENLSSNNNKDFNTNRNNSNNNNNNNSNSNNNNNNVSSGTGNGRQVARVQPLLPIDTNRGDADVIVTHSKNLVEPDVTVTSSKWGERSNTNQKSTTINKFFGVGKGQVNENKQNNTNKLGRRSLSLKSNGRAKSASEIPVDLTDEFIPRKEVSVVRNIPEVVSLGVKEDIIPDVPDVILMTQDFLGDATPKADPIHPKNNIPDLPDILDDDDDFIGLVNEICEEGKDEKNGNPPQENNSKIHQKNHNNNNTNNNNNNNNSSSNDNNSSDFQQLLEMEDELEAEMANSQELFPDSPVLSSRNTSRNTSRNAKDINSVRKESRTTPVFSKNSETSMTNKRKCSEVDEEANTLPPSAICEFPLESFMDSARSQNFEQLQKLRSTLENEIEQCMEKWKLLCSKRDEVEKLMMSNAERAITPSNKNLTATSLLNRSSTSSCSSDFDNANFRNDNTYSSTNATSSVLFEKPSSRTLSVKSTSITSNNISKQSTNSSASWLSAHEDLDDFPKSTVTKKSSPVKCHNTSYNQGPEVDPSFANHPMLPRVRQVLKSSFGLRDFRENQLNAILTVLEGKDCFVLMPTGGGKSLCYQLTALLLEGVTIVVSPLRSLIFDQVQKLRSLKIQAAYLSSDVSPAEENEVFHNLGMYEPTLKLLYVTPEKVSLSSKLASTFKSLYSKNKLSLFVIDEAHCVSQWGHDFRPDYKKLNALRRDYPRVPIMGLTATATPRVQTDILVQLMMRDTKVFKQSFNRQNLQYFVLPKAKATLGDMANKIKSEFANKSGIIYCFSKKDTEHVADFMQSNGVQAACYHAGLTDKQRSERQENWMKNRFRVVCATIAFGMGIDKPDVRFVFHYTIPKSVEGYFQESGRAGRDGRKAICVLYYTYADMHKIRRMIESDDVNRDTLKVHMDNLYRVVAFCENKVDCRRAQQMHYFGEDKFDSSLCKQNTSTTCDNCAITRQVQQLDATEDARTIIRSVNKLCHQDNSDYRHPIANYNIRMTLNQFVDAFRGTSKGSNVQHLALWNLGAKYTKMDSERLFRHLVITRVLAEEIILGNHGNIVAYLKLGPKFQDVLQGRMKVNLNIHTKKESSTTAAKKRKTMEFEDPPQLKALKERCMDELIELRTEIANHNHLPNPESIININVLRRLSDQLPTNAEEMFNVEGIAESWFQMWGEEFLQITRNFKQQVADLNLGAHGAGPTGEITELRSHYFDETDDYDDITGPPTRGGGRGGRGGWRGGRGGRGGGRNFSKYKKRGGGGAKRGKNTSSGWPPAWQSNSTASNTSVGPKSRAAAASKLGLMDAPFAKRAKR